MAQPSLPGADSVPDLDVAALVEAERARTRLMGESLGLKWSDIDFEAGTLRVHRQVQRIREGGGLVFSEPKNASRRTIDLPQRTLEALRSNRKRQLEEQLRAGGKWQDNGLVFASSKGTLWMPRI